jgi:formylglycine-generating enzyme required for sulfatase activity
MFGKAIVRGFLMAAAVLWIPGVAIADIFGAGESQFTLDFVPISGATNPTSGYGIVNNDYRMGTKEITNDQWNKFKTNLNKPVTGYPSGAYNEDFDNFGTGTTNVPTNNVSWYEAAQFVNWLNTNTGHQAAYNFTGTQGTSNYTLTTWGSGEADGTNLYRNKAAYYYLPTENEWVKAAYWNGTTATLQTYATKAGQTLFQGNGTNGGWNYYDTGYATEPYGPWNVGSGSEELNGTYDMMGNVMEWLESPLNSGDYDVGSSRGVRGGAWSSNSDVLAASNRPGYGPSFELNGVGFRVASVPEPSSLIMLVGLALTALLCWWRKLA